MSDTLQMIGFLTLAIGSVFLIVWIIDMIVRHYETQRQIQYLYDDMVEYNRSQLLVARTSAAKSIPDSASGTPCTEEVVV